MQNGLITKLAEKYQKQFETLPDNFLHCLKPNQPQDPAELCFPYEQDLSQEKTQKGGIFYTPRNIVEYMTQMSLENYRSGPICDPACGTGIFLLTTFRALISGIESLVEKTEILTSRIFGADLDSEALSICRFLLLAVLFERETELPISLPDLRKNIVEGNSLHRDSSPLERLFMKQTGSHGFALVIGNPPYGLKRDEKLSEEENKLLRKLYAEYLNGKVNKYLLFIARGLELLSEKGTLSFIIPNSWLGIKDAEKLRKILLENKLIEEISIFEKPVFKNASVEAVILKLRKNNPKNIFKVTHFESNKTDKKIAAFQIPCAACQENNSFEISIRWHDSCPELFKIFKEDCFPLGSDNSPFTSYIALQAYATGKGNPKQTITEVKNHVFHTKEKKDETCIPYLEGKDISRYEHNWSGNYLKYGPWLAEHQPVKRYTSPRIAIREIINPAPQILQAAYLEESFCYNRSILHILSDTDDKKLLLALTAILNSSVGSFIVAFKGKKSQRKIFPKIVNDDLKNFPLPAKLLTDSTIVEDLAECAENILPGGIEPGKTERLVQKLYNISPDLEETMKEALTQF